MWSCVGRQEPYRAVWVCACAPSGAAGAVSSSMNFVKLCGAAGAVSSCVSSGMSCVELCGAAGAV